MPNVNVQPPSSTDQGAASHGMARIRPRINGQNVAYITGEPAPPQVYAQFTGLPDAMKVGWNLAIRTERPQRGNLDDRDFPGNAGSTDLPGHEPWSFTSAANNEIIGGKCVLSFEVAGNNPDNAAMNIFNSSTFFIRGKNPLDADVRAFIDANVNPAFVNFAWAIFVHETKAGNRIYNQFNPAGAYAELPNKDADPDRDGWGIGQIDRKKQGGTTSTAEVWDWHANVISANAIIIQKRAEHRERIGWFREMYGQQTNWQEPPAEHPIGNTTLSAEEWGIIVNYNGRGGTPETTRPPGSIPPNFQSPWKFDPVTGKWSFHDNQRGYAAIIRALLENPASITPPTTD
jgi:hypothetical protein